MKLLNGMKETTTDLYEDVSRRKVDGNINKLFQNQKEDDEEDVIETEIVNVIEGLKLNKAVGVDGIPAKAWKIGRNKVRRELSDLIRKIWKNGNIPTEWKTSIVVPLYKRGERES